MSTYPHLTYRQLGLSLQDFADALFSGMDKVQLKPLMIYAGLGMYFTGIRYVQP